MPPLLSTLYIEKSMAGNPVKETMSESEKSEKEKKVKEAI